jgi:hypothetical protein
MNVVRQLLFTIFFLQFAYTQVAPTLKPSLFYEDKAAIERGSSRPFVDGNGNVIIITTQFSVSCPFGVCGTNVYSIAPSGTPNWIKPDPGFASHAVNQIALSADNTIYFQDFAQLGQVLAYSSAGVPVPGWPVNLGFPLATGPHTLVVDPLDGSILLKGGTNFSFSTFPGRVAAYHPDASLKWQADFANAPNNTPGMIVGPDDTVYTYTDRGLILTGDQGSLTCSFGQHLSPIAGGATGVFTYNGTQILRINPDCTVSAIFTEPTGTLILTDYDNGILFAADGPQNSLFAVRSDGTFLWRNQAFIPSGSTFISAIHGGRLYVFGVDVVDQKQKLFVLDENSGAILDAADTTGLCSSCGVAVAPNGAIYLNDLQSTRIYSFGDRFLHFPLRGILPGQNESLTASTAPIITVFDHSMRSEAGQYEIYAPATPDGIVEAFSADKGVGPPETQGCYQDGGKDFSSDIPNYVGPRGIGSTSLCYDNHPGIDFRAALGTEVYASVDGTVHYPTAIVGIRRNNLAFTKYHVLEIIPADPIQLPYRIFYLHLSTHPDTGQSIIRNDTSGSPCPSVVTLPLPEGTPVKAGCLIALSGAAGAPHGAHLHFEVHKVLPIENVPLDIRRVVECPDDATKACVPVDPYGWTGNPNEDPYTVLTGIKLAPLWR